MKTPIYSSAAVRGKRSCPLRIAVIFASLYLALCMWPAQLVADPPQASVTQLWVQHYSETTSNATDSARHVVVDLAGDVIVTGYTDNNLNGQDILTIKYSGLNGSILWQRRYDAGGNTNDAPSGLGVDRSGNVIVVGTSQYRGASAFYTAKYASADGALLWERRDRGGPTNRSFATAMALDGDGNVVVIGNSQTFEPNSTDFYIVKYAAADGATLWSARHDGGLNDFAQYIALDRHGNAIVTGSSFTLQRSGVYTAKYAAGDGALLWSHRYNRAPQFAVVQPLAVAVDAEDNAIVTARSSYERAEWYTLKYAPDGAVVWENQYSGFNPYGGYGSKPLIIDSTGDIILVSPIGGGFYKMVRLAKADGAVLWQQRFGVNLPLTTSTVSIGGTDEFIIAANWYDGTARGLYLASYSILDGALLWQYHNGTPVQPLELFYHYIYYDLAFDPDGNIVVAGSSPGVARNGDFATAKFSAADGAVLWEAEYDGPLVHNAYAQAVAIDDNGDVAVTGPVGTQETYDYYTAKYAKTTGALLWQTRYNSPANSRDEAQALALDSSGNVIVAGTSWNKTVTAFDPANYSAPADFYTAKYAAATGALLWERRYNAPADGPDLAAALAIDSHDNVIVTGTSWNGSTSDFYTAKYAASDGALIWEQRAAPKINQNGYQNCYARGMTVDRRGNVVITGDIYDDFGFYSSTIKYAAENGALVWTKLVGPSATADFHALGVAADNAGNVVVTGYSYNGTDYDAYTAKYASATGNLLWEQRYKGPPNRAATASAVAVDHHGNVVITGQAEKDAGNLDIFTASYRGSDGMLLWEQQHNGSDNGNDYGVALRINNAGHIVIAGNANNGSHLESYLASYSPRDGELLWETTYDGPFNRDNYVAPSSGLAVGPDGLIAIAGTGSGYDLATIVYQENLHPSRAK